MRKTLALLALLLTGSVYGQVIGPLTVLRHFKMGEADSGAVEGAVVTQTVDSVSTNALTMTGEPHYSSDSPQYYSTSTIDFSGAAQWGATPNPDLLTTNFGVETWVKPVSASGTRFILYSGTAGSGWGIVQLAETGTFRAIFGGRTNFGEGEIKVGEWTHLAFVVTGETATFYVNGLPSGPSVTNNPAPPESTLFIGTSPTLGAYFGGKMDDVRIFTFEPGTFTPDLLLYKPPLALTFTQNGTNVTLSWPLAYPRFSLLTTTNLATSWQLVSTPAKLDGTYQITQPMRPGIVNEPIVPQRFFGLKEDVSQTADPKLGDGKYIVITSGGQAKNVTNYNAANANRIINSSTSSIDARAFVDPSDPNGNLLPLQFHWVVKYPTQPDLPYTAAGMKGYFAPVLTMDSATMATQPSPPNVNGRGVEFTVEVYSPNTGRTAVHTIQAQIVGSALTLSQYNDCQGETEACSTCICRSAAALPTTDPY
ncbi:MAG: hypothetical protein JWM68_4787 [Verrucomicrobiales bacterium]|nr:hypothetical protein [Verrucomicrobiales bacterium]